MFTFRKEKKLKESENEVLRKIKAPTKHYQGSSNS
jgi:hypothetical protein